MTSASAVARRPATGRAPVADPACAQAVELAWSAAAAVGATDALAWSGNGSRGRGELVGEHLGFTAEGDRVGTHWFLSNAAGYPDWQWAVTVVRAARARTVTVDEVALVPGPSSLRPPAWVPWVERVAPGDLGPGDLLPSPPDDPRLEPGYTGADGDPEQVATVADELGLGRARVLSPIGRDDAADRWVGTGAGGDDPVARSAPAPCSTCGFLVSLAGPLHQAFGVCANAYSPRDAMVVAFDHGCGAHSDVGLVRVPGQSSAVLDTGATDELSVIDPSEVADLGLPRPAAGQNGGDSTE